MARKYPEGYYVYLHIRKTDGQVFYVGKGRGDRVYLASGMSRSEHWKRVYNKHGRDIVFVKKGMSEACALTLEKILIAKYRYLGAPLVNQTDGGEGLSGFIPPRSMEVFSSLGERFTSSNAASRYLRINGFPKASHAAIQKCCKGKKHTAYGRAWSYSGFPPHPEKVGNENRGEWQRMNEGHAVETSCGLSFISINSAVRWLRENGWPKAGKQPISYCCRGIRKSAYGYIWKYTRDKTTDNV